LGAALIPGISGGARAATGSVVQAEGDAYAVAAVASLLGSGPTQVGPVSPALASVPPGHVLSSAPSLARCGNGTGTGCTDPLTTAVDVVQSNADAGIRGVTAHCDGAPPGIGGNTVVGGSACVTIASAATLNTGSSDKPADVVVGTGISAISQTQGCGSTASTGTVRIKSLVVNSTTVVGPDPIETAPAPNTVVPLGAVTVILNEQHYDAQGHGLTVNAVHVFTSSDLGSLANVDLTIGHTHSEAMCDSGTVLTPPANPNAAAANQSLPAGTKADSTKSANPGEVVTYTLGIAGNGCKVVSIVDTLPSGFSYVAGSATGDLGTTPSVTQSPANSAVQQLEWYNPTGWSADKLSEALQVKVPASSAPGMYVNNVAGDAAPPMAKATIACGAFVFSDTLPLDGPVAADNGINPGVIVPRSVVGASVRPAGQPGVVPAGAEAAAAALVGTPNTAAAPPAGLLTTSFALAGLGAAALLGRRRARRSSG
jgi:uncharacterized repeat protein (TIGR01451 family)